MVAEMETEPIEAEVDIHQDYQKGKAENENIYYNAKTMADD